MAQHCTTEDIVAAIHAGEHALIGIGLTRRCLAGAALGLLDGQDAFGRAEPPNPVVRYAAEALAEHYYPLRPPA